MNVSELNIPVAWGHVAVKTWGSEKNYPILMYHGAWDNAGSFDRLIPYLPRNYYYICIDFPGHGKSSHFPYGTPMHTVNLIVVYKIVADHFNRKKYIIIGHSWGGQMAFLFTQLYPEYVTKLIILDTLYLYPITADYFKDYMKDRLAQVLEINKKLFNGYKQPSYTYDEALNKLRESRLYGEIKKEAAEALLIRGLTPTNDRKFRFTIDPRIRYHVNLFYSRRYVNDLVKKYPITCPVLFIMAEDSLNVTKYFKTSFKDLQKLNTQCFIRKVRGNHDVHNNNPEVVAPIILNFLSYGSSKL